MFRARPTVWHVLRGGYGRLAPKMSASVGCPTYTLCRVCWSSHASNASNARQKLDHRAVLNARQFREFWKSTFHHRPKEIGNVDRHGWCLSYQGNLFKRQSASGSVNCATVVNLTKHAI